jgi:hypothetical protein
MVRHLGIIGLWEGDGLLRQTPTITLGDLWLHMIVPRQDWKQAM